MSQLFKDCSREALALRGTTGLITLWLATLPDLFKTAFEENFKEITHMSKEKFHRLGRLAFALGALLVFPALGVISSERSSGLIEYLRFGVGPVAMLLFFVGIAALRSAYGDSAGTAAKAWLTLSAAAALISMVVAITAGLYLGNWGGTVFFGGQVVMLLGIGLFGVYCLRRGVLPGLNWLLVIGGLLFPVSSLGFVTNVFNGVGLGFLLFGISLLSLVAAGLLQPTQETTPKPSR